LGGIALDEGGEVLVQDVVGIEETRQLVLLDCRADRFSLKA